MSNDHDDDDDFDREANEPLTDEEYARARSGDARAEFDVYSARIGRHPRCGYIYLGQLLAYVDRLRSDEWIDVAARSAADTLTQHDRDKRRGDDLRNEVASVVADAIRNAIVTSRR